MRYHICLALSFLLVGCASSIDRISDRAADAVSAYCDNFTQVQRDAFGAAVRAKAVPNSIVVTCAD